VDDSVAAASSPTMSDAPTASRNAPSARPRLNDVLAALNSSKIDVQAPTPVTMGQPWSTDQMTDPMAPQVGGSLQLASQMSQKLQQQQSTADLVEALKGAPQDTSIDTWSQGSAANGDSESMASASRGGTSGE